MFAAMGILLLVAVQSLGGPGNAIDTLHGVPGFMDWFPRDLALPGAAGALLFAVSWLFAGLSVIGQPHVMVRFMALEDSGRMRRARTWYYLWFTGFYAMATAVGMLSRIYLPEAGNFDAELALPNMALGLLPPVLVGLVLAGIFAATMSTADSLILSCSAAITHDLLPHRIERPALLKLTTIAITGAALGLALINSQSVFSLVIMAWSALASAFAPLLLALCLGRTPGERHSLVALVAGLGVALLWRYLGLHEAVYEGLPGIVTGLLVLLIPTKKFFAQ